MLCMLRRAASNTDHPAPVVMSYLDRRRYGIMDAAYDRTQLTLQNLPGLGVCNTSGCYSFTIDYVKPGPAIRAYMTPMGALLTSHARCVLMAACM